jgi:demethylspheroidene O-methyltransferase
MSGTNLPAPVGPVSVGEILRQGRNLLVSNPSFQKWAASFPLTRLLAERQSNALFDLCSGFVYSQILLASVRLDLFTKLSGGPRTIVALAEDLGLPVDATQRLVRATTSLNLTDKLEGERYTLGELGAALLANPALAAFVEHHAMLYKDLTDPVDLLKGKAQTELSGFWPYGKPGEAAPAESYARYSELMSQSQTLIADDILDAFQPSTPRSWLDLGGGEGVFAAALADFAPQIEVTMIDLPPVAARARAALQTRGMLSRVKVQDGDFFTDPLPAGPSVVSLIRILHDYDDDQARALLARIHAATEPGATLLVAEPMSGGGGADRASDAYFNFYLLAMGRGRARSVSEMTDLLTAAGFGDVRSLPSRRPLLASILVAQRV